MKAILLIISITLSLILLDFGSIADAKAQDVVYNETHQLVENVSHVMVGQFCKHGATLILLGKYEQAEQYNKDFGQCMRNLVRKVQLIR